MKREKKLLKRPKLFNPDDVARRISSALARDLDSSSDCFWKSPASAYFVAAQKKGTLKKYYSSGDSKLQEQQAQAAYQLFRQTNEHMAQYCYAGLNLPNPVDNIPHLGGYDSRDIALLRARHLVRTVVRDLGTDEIYEACKLSNGVSAGVGFADTSIDAKFTYPITGTADAVSLFLNYLTYDPILREAIEGLNGAPLERSSFKIVSYSRATTVDKDSLRKRFIAVEPTLNMFFQQGLMLLLYRRLQDFGLDIYRAQDVHKRLARDSSISNDLATIDFSSASDCVSSDLLEWLLPPKWYGWLDKVRTGFVRVTPGEVLPCHMFATMGNATTFPLETLLFWALGWGAVCRESLPNNSRIFTLTAAGLSPTEVRVFGDDCILRRTAAPFFMDLCKSVGFIVNTDKSFFNLEHFRESCGGDYYRGYDVRPYHVRPPHSNKLSSLEPWLYIIMNRSLERYISYFGNLTYVYDKELLRELACLFREFKLKVKLVPPWYPDDAGLKLGPDRGRLRRYGFEFDKIVHDAHGTYSFKYMRFVYKERRDLDDHLHYAVELKRLYQKRGLLENVDLTDYQTVRSILRPGSPENDRFSPVKRVGGYVVARGVSSHWDLADHGE